MFYTWLVFYVYSHYFSLTYTFCLSYKSISLILTFKLQNMLKHIYIQCSSLKILCKRYIFFTHNIFTIWAKLHSYFFPTENKIISWEINHHSIIQLLTVMQSKPVSWPLIPKTTLLCEICLHFHLDSSNKSFECFKKSLVFLIRFDILFST